MNSTIFALSSAPGRAGVAVVRVSGPLAGPALTGLAGPLPAPRQAVLRRLAFDGAQIDRALVLWFAGPVSFTGEDLAELHIHGGRAVREAVFSALLQLGLRPAEPGEFSRRAVENGKLDLTRAEAIADVIDAETPAQLRQALRQQDGALADLYEGWRAALIAALGRAEAAIDFSDDGVGDAEFAAARGAAAKIYQQIQSHMDDSGRGEALREGLRLTILGPPNPQRNWPGSKFAPVPHTMHRRGCCRCGANVRRSTEYGSWSDAYVLQGTARDPRGSTRDSGTVAPRRITS